MIYASQYRSTMTFLFLITGVILNIPDSTSSMKQVKKGRRENLLFYKNLWSPLRRQTHVIHSYRCIVYGKRNLLFQWKISFRRRKKNKKQHHLIKVLLPLLKFRRANRAMKFFSLEKKYIFCSNEATKRVYSQLWALRKLTRKEEDEDVEVEVVEEEEDAQRRSIISWRRHFFLLLHTEWILKFKWHENRLSLTHSLLTTLATCCTRSCSEFQ